MLGQGETIKDFQHRFPILFGSILTVFFLLSLRLVFLQVYRGQLYREFSEKNSLRKETTPAPRGQVYDREQKLLVDNRLQLDIVITPQYAKNLNAVLRYISQISEESYDRLLERYRARLSGVFKFQPVTLIENAPWNVVVLLESSKTDLPGVEVIPRIRRTYLHQHVGSHLFGYLSEVSRKDLESFEKEGIKDYSLGDFVGRSGLEKQWEKYLKGVEGIQYVEVDAHGHRLSSIGQERTILHDLPPAEDAKPGANLHLTIDEDLQLVAAAAMKGKMGAVVALDPRTGEVLTMISQPSFDPTDMSEKGPDLWQSIVKNPYSPLRNKTLQDHFPAGSTFKVFTALAALEGGIVTPQTSVRCPGFYKFGKRIYNCHKKEGHGYVDLHSAIAGSCDVYFYHIASRLGIDAISKMAVNFGLGSRTGIDLANEVPGIMPTEEWKLSQYKQEWTPGETLSASIGQGYNLVTPLQVAVAYSTLVNGGNLYKPYVVSKIETIQGEILKKFQPELISNYKINPEHLGYIKEALFDVANAPTGTASAFVKTPEKLISGKSGTAQVISLSREDLFKPCQNLPFEKRHHAWFVGYAPRENPEIVVSVLGMHECGGSRNASPVVKAVIEKWWEKKKLLNQMHGPMPSVR
jgi:penicillin-binding protein 2